MILPKLCWGVALVLAAIPAGLHSHDEAIPRASRDSIHQPAQAPTPMARVASFGTESPSVDARRLADWIALSGDNAGAAFIVVDKKNARLYAFDADARLSGSTAVLVGAAPGDESVPGIGSRPLAEVRPEERTTPAGRFVAEAGHNARGEDIVWVDYDAAVSMHRVRTTNPGERRLERLATPSTDDNRISYGCINVPVAFYERIVRAMFASDRAFVYVLPEVKSLTEVFGSFDSSDGREQAGDRTRVVSPPKRALSLR